MDGKIDAMTSRNADERRTAQRMATRIDAVARSVHGERHRLEITDLSTTGCAIMSHGHPLNAKTAYGLKMAGLETLGSITEWTDGKKSGLRFERHLHPAVADHIAARNPPACEAIQPAERALPAPAGTKELCGDG